MVLKHHFTRPDLNIIFDLIPPQSAVLDLGCGEGSLLHKLITEKQVQGHGVELSDESVFECVAKGVPVVHSDLNEGLDDYPDAAFDFVVLSQTLQQVARPDRILPEMLRVGRTGIISFINFGYWQVRGSLFFTGKMPKSKALPFEWYDTPNIHLSTISDFRRLCSSKSIQIIRQINIVHHKQGRLLPNILPNLFTELAVFVIKSR